MSAYMEDAEHLRVLVWAALDLRRPRHESELRWQVEDVPEGVSDPVLGLVWNRYYGGYREVTHQSADEIMLILASENIRSLRARYSDADESGMIPDLAEYRYGRGPRDKKWSNQEVARAIQGFEYQACEHPDWQKSEAYRFCQALKDRLLDRMIGDVETWSIHDDSSSAQSKRETQVWAELMTRVTEGRDE